MTTRGSVGWLILAAALALPAFYYYAWWSRVNSDSRSQMSQKVRRRLPEGEGLFAGAPAQNKLVNPIAAAAAPSPTPAAAPTPGLPSQPALPAAAPGTPPVSPPAAGQISSAAMPPAVLFARDPTISQYDLVRIKRREEEKLIKRDEVRQAVRKAAPRKREPGVETTVELQGIISNPDTGNKAIVNGEMVGAGDSVGQVKVVRITAQSVVFSHKGRRFTKTISK